MPRTTEHTRMHTLPRSPLFSFFSRRRLAAAATAGLLMASAAPLVSPLAVAWVAKVAVVAVPAPRPVVNTAEVEVGRLAAHIAETWNTTLPASQRIVAAAFTQAEAQRISPTLILAVVAQESGFRPAARSGYGAEGLMQVSARHHPDKLRGLQRNALLKPETNIRVGTQVLAEYLDQNQGRLDPALRKYSGNAGAYSRKVRAFWASLEKVRLTA